MEENVPTATWYILKAKEKQMTSAALVTLAMSSRGGSVTVGRMGAHVPMVISFLKAKELRMTTAAAVKMAML